MCRASSGPAWQNPPDRLRRLAAPKPALSEVEWAKLGDGFQTRLTMDNSSTILRPANPTIEEGLAFARYLDQAAEGFFRFMLGPRVADIIATAYTQPDHDLSYQHITFAERDSAIVGMTSGYTADQHRRSSLQPFKNAPGRPALRMTAVTILCAPVLRILDTIADGDFYLLAIAVDEALHGQGLGSTLFEAIENHARAAGSARLSLHVSAKNERARSFYERHGMTIQSQWPKRIPIPGFRLLHLTKPL
jgi:ribosomal protein S18 acetylase RimI-like enzyme